MWISELDDLLISDPDKDWSTDFGHVLCDDVETAPLLNNDP